MTGGIRVNQQFCLQGALSHSPARGYFTPGLMAPPLPLEGPGVVFPELVGVAGLETGVDAFSLGIDWNGRNDFLKTCIMQMEREWSRTHKSHKSCVHNEINNWEIVSCSTAIDCIRKEEQNQSVYFIPKCNKFNTWNDSKSSLAESFSVYNYCPPATKVINSKRERERKKRKEKKRHRTSLCFVDVELPCDEASLLGLILSSADFLLAKSLAFSRGERSPFMGVLSYNKQKFFFTKLMWEIWCWLGQRFIS